MSTRQAAIPESPPVRTGLPNGAGAAALFAASVGAFVLAALAVAADHIASLKSLMIFYKPTGPLSGVTTSAIVLWLLVWAILDARWKQRTVALRSIVSISLVLLALSFVLMFPPVSDLF